MYIPNISPYVEAFIKRSGEAFTRSISYQDRLPLDVMPVSVTASVVCVQDGQSYNLITGTSAEGYNALYSLTGGVDGYDYVITITSTMSNGNIFVDKILMQVSDTLI